MKVRKSRIAIAIASVVALASVALAGPADAGNTIRVREAVRACKTPKAGHAQCFAMKSVYKTVRAGSLEAQRAAAQASVAPNIALGPNGGYSPDQIAKAYNLDVNAAPSATQTVGIVDAFNDPNVVSDLNTFDENYGLPDETVGTTFKVVNQSGLTSPLPTNNAGWAEEITLDVQSVRGLCHACKILLVETTDNSFQNLATGVNEAVTLGATEVSNSYGGAESSTEGNTSIISAYDHPGIPILASSGDDGFFSWDTVNQMTNGQSESDVPASYRTVVGVGGTSLFVNADGTRAGETAWNENGPGDVDGFNLSASMGAAGSGCSQIYTPKPWQQNISGFTALGCGTARSEVDIAAIADPFTGFDIFDTVSEPGWITLGGTSLASPVVAAMFALSGGGHGITYPSLTLYGHLKSDTSSHVNDIKIGGTGLCGTMPVGQCFTFSGGNPNTFGIGYVDCGFAASPNNISAILANRTQCNAAPGFDGVSGVGTPNGVFVFSKIAPKGVITGPSTAIHGHSASWSASSSTDPFPGATISSHHWNWGDGTTSSGTTISHTYAHSGTFTITLTLTDSYGVASTAVTKHVTVS
jgi:subtilase family serine protease